MTKYEQHVDTYVHSHLDLKYVMLIVYLKVHLKNCEIYGVVFGLSADLQPTCNHGNSSKVILGVVCTRL